ncbi:MAG: hypothetical protein ACFFG0_06245 [Candidatus Thorarchaeota archaeon]
MQSQTQAKAEGICVNITLACYACKFNPEREKKIIGKCVYDEFKEMNNEENKIIDNKFIENKADNNLKFSIGGGEEGAIKKHRGRNKVRFANGTNEKE